MGPPSLGIALERLPRIPSSSIREDFDFVVVDTSPILPVADARFVSQYVDTVVLSVFRDVSESAKIQAACDILAAFGRQFGVEAVVTGPSHGLYGRQQDTKQLFPPNSENSYDQ